MTTETLPDGMSTIPTAELIDLQNALLHRVMRRHKHSAACDGCAIVVRVVKRLVGLEETGALR